MLAITVVLPGVFYEEHPVLPEFFLSMKPSSSVTGACFSTKKGAERIVGLARSDINNVRMHRSRLVLLSRERVGCGACWDR
jgi:hypothetical protein